MYITGIDIKNFRNYENLSLSFAPGTNVLYGDNAQGKTNVLEAIQVLGTTRSHRGARDKDMIRFGEEEAHLRLFFHKGQATHRIDMHLKKGGKKGAAVDGVPIRRSGDLFGLVQLVFFSPEDLNIVKNGPHERRRFLDSELCQLNRVYYQQLAAYQRAVQQRNALLKEIVFQPQLADTLDVWDAQLVQYGVPIMRERAAFVKQLADIAGRMHAKLTGGAEALQLTYEPNVSAEAFAEKLMQSRERDKKQKLSSVGPHRDDLRVSLAGMDLRSFGSQGQQRSAALSMKLSEIELVRQVTRESPVLLLDDVLSELDSRRQAALLSNMNQVQTILTCTGMDEMMQHHFFVDRKFHIVSGSCDAID